MNFKLAPARAMPLRVQVSLRRVRAQAIGKIDASTSKSKLMSSTLAELKEAAEGLSLPAGGTKKILTQRLMAHARGEASDAVPVDTVTVLAQRGATAARPVPISAIAEAAAASDRDWAQEIQALDSEIKNKMDQVARLRESDRAAVAALAEGITQVAGELAELKAMWASELAKIDGALDTRAAEATARAEVTTLREEQAALQTKVDSFETLLASRDREISMMLEQLSTERAADAQQLAVLAFAGAAGSDATAPAQPAARGPASWPLPEFAAEGGSSAATAAAPPAAAAAAAGAAGASAGAARALGMAAPGLAAVITLRVASKAALGGYALMRDVVVHDARTRATVDVAATAALTLLALSSLATTFASAL